jgi:hypothetical protein
MTRSGRTAVILGLVAALLIGGSVAGTAGGSKALDASMVGIPAAKAGQPFLGAIGGGLPWRLDRGEAKLFRDGRVQVTVVGLVLAAGANEGRNPIPTGQALVSCDGAVVAQSSAVPFSPEGDAQVDETVALPETCLAPVVFFAGITGAGPRWFAVMGW